MYSFDSTCARHARGEGSPIIRVFASGVGPNRYFAARAGVLLTTHRSAATDEEIINIFTIDVDMLVLNSLEVCTFRAYVPEETVDDIAKAKPYRCTPLATICAAEFTVD